VEICEKTDDGGKSREKIKNAADETSNLARPLTSRLKEAAKAFIEFADERNKRRPHVLPRYDSDHPLAYGSSPP
jgi:hypothetical protein